MNNTCKFSTHRVLFDNNGNLWTFGRNDYGQLGHGSGTHNNAVPQKLEFPTDVIAVGTGERHSFAITKKLELYAWGKGRNGELGLGEPTVNINTPTKVEGVPKIVAVAGGNSHSIALSNTGEVWSWGVGKYGILGRGVSKSPFPGKITSISDIVSIASGDYFCCAINKKGELFTWGCGDHYQLGHGDNLHRDVPTKVENVPPIVSVTCGYRHIMVLTAAGDVYRWGDGWQGRLGNGSRNSIHLPTNLVVDDWKPVAVAVGDCHSLCLTYDGEVYSWGYKQTGRLGRPDDDFANPKKIPNLKDVVAISAGFRTSYALTKNGEMKSWGHGIYGQLGTGDSEDKDVPTLIPTTSSTQLHWRTHANQSFSTILLLNIMWPVIRLLLMGTRDRQSSYSQLFIDNIVEIAHIMFRL
jgi:alpha-tubulin suppressor-like RCC1 family protein